MLNLLVFIILAGRDVQLTLETTLIDKENIIVGSTIIQKGDKIRIDETLPNSEEIGLVIISDSKECWHIPVIGNPSKIPPIKDIFKILGIDRARVKEEAEQSATQVKEKKQPITPQAIRYKNFIETEDLGLLPKVIEFYNSKGMLKKSTEIKGIREEINLSNELFDKNKVKFSLQAKKIAKEQLIY